ncbi:MAG: M42 family metallopeptidase [Anaerolineae bacterium]|nr:M42 family metallopeptidase [Thermoflexales bacterium]MDW8408728.1 M42 family metallopeptidase [Anaerolineae bacterium]
MILEKLSSAVGVSGNEDAVREVILKLIKGHVDDVTLDSMGNVITYKAAHTTRGQSSTQAGLRIMLAAHMDEVGLMVTGYTSDGGIKFRYIGGMDDRLMPGLRVQIGKDRTPGVIGLKAIHNTKHNEREKAVPVESLVIDVGASSKSEAETLAPLGTYGTFLAEYRRLGNLLSGKAFDDRVGCAVLVELLQQKAYPVDVFGVFTVQEEVGLRGAGIAAYRVNPTHAFVLEGTIADDLPKKKDESPTTQLGKGPALSVLDRSVIADRRLVDHLIATADKHDIPYQFKQPGIGGTDAGAIHLVREGVPTAPISVPCRYIHGPVAVLDPRDYRNTVRLTELALRELHQMEALESASG